MKLKEKNNQSTQKYIHKLQNICPKDVLKKDPQLMQIFSKSNDLP